MPQLPAHLKQVDMLRERIIKDLLPDTCQIIPLIGANPVITGGVLTSSAPQARTWRSTTNIPCRLDLSRAFRPGRLKTQNTEIDEYNAEFPFDVVVEPSDLIVVTDPETSEVQTFEVLKRKTFSKFDGTVECVIDAIGTPVDAHS